MRRMIAGFREADDSGANEAANHLQRALSEWLTLPLPFDSAVTQRLQFLGAPETFARHWGDDMGKLYRSALEASHALVAKDNPLCTVLAEQLRSLQKQGSDFRVFCHRTAVPLYMNLFSLPNDTKPPAKVFLHSCRDYRDSEPFDVLVKLGPLRSRGWGAAPDAILTAPRFTKLLQIVWSGCNDESEFGYDPVAAVGRSEAELSSMPMRDNTTHALGIRWEPRSYKVGEVEETLATGMPDADDFQLFKDLMQEQGRDDRPAVLVQFDDEQGILYPPLSQVLCFDPMCPDEVCIGSRIPGETLAEDTYILRSILQESRLGEPQAQHGRFSQIWKDCLRKQFHENPSELIRKLSAAGLQLLRLDLAIAHWLRAPTTVIHAPQQKRHFEILVRILGVDFAPVAPAYLRGRALWEYAWNEICLSRGEAIHAGVLNHAQTEDQLRVILKGMLPKIRSLAQAGGSFSVALPRDSSLSGTVLFDRVRAIEEGFRVPVVELRQTHDLDEVEQWRV